MNDFSDHAKDLGYGSALARYTSRLNAAEQHKDWATGDALHQVNERKKWLHIGPKIELDRPSGSATERTHQAKRFLGRDIERHHFPQAIADANLRIARDALGTRARSSRLGTFRPNSRIGTRGLG